MKWQGGRRSGNIEDRRGMSGGQKFAFGGIGAVVIVIISLFMGGDPTQILDQLQQQSEVSTSNEPYESSEAEDKLINFADVVLASTEDVWGNVFQEDLRRDYPKLRLAVYNGAVETAGCGVGKSSFGPFYCPADQRIYLDLSFNEELQQKYGAKGEFALAYVIAHEVGHHIQHVLGLLDKTNAMRAKLDERAYNKISVMTELQADFYAGVWAHYAGQYSDVDLNYDDILAGMQAAAAVGDDHLQEQAYGRSNPESFTHGTSEQRAYWFKKGYDTGDINAGNTFVDPSLQ
ncbi:KPN_02809 family neutral zinc metallopeptidase [Sphingobacterium bambusae]|uniref:Neutral zinc metallopeptidase n=1 Tax=Sphingobacterium bambusae TaxID=662858 RepID=A0ABW6BJU6_9SPHI|nr:neutral zinc metallopeptidase [Sphingobacterium bambusae]WPL48948.1 neutral zinc metallopeptidase [Sphingobacterium bambusae]